MELINEYPWLLAFIIFFARVVDVTLGTFRTIVVFRGFPALAAIIGFVEVFIWLLASGQVLSQLDKWYLAVAYAAGFGAGNYTGILLESKLAIGKELVRAISFQTDGMLASILRQHGFRVIDIEGDMGPNNRVDVVFAIVKRKRVPALIRLINETDPEAIYSISDIKSAFEGQDQQHTSSGLLPFNMGWRTRGKRK